MLDKKFWLCLSLLITMIMSVSFDSIVKPQSAIAQASVIHTDATCDKNPVEIVSGDKGERVINLQKVLAKLGLDPGPVDGTFGAATLAAIKEFQASRGLQVDGKVGPNTQAALCSELTAMSGDATCDNNPGTLVSGAKGDRVFNLQKSLTKLGLNAGNIDGIFASSN